MNCQGRILLPRNAVMAFIGNAGQHNLNYTD